MIPSFVAVTTICTCGLAEAVDLLYGYRYRFTYQRGPRTLVVTGILVGEWQESLIVRSTRGRLYSIPTNRLIASPEYGGPVQ